MDICLLIHSSVLCHCSRIAGEILTCCDEDNTMNLTLAKPLCYASQKFSLLSNLSNLFKTKMESCCCDINEPQKREQSEGACASLSQCFMTTADDLCMGRTVSKEWGCHIGTASMSALPLLLSKMHGQPDRQRDRWAER